MAHSASFWDNLKVQTGETTLGRLTYDTILVTSDSGFKQCCADETMTGGHHIVECDCDRSKRVYYLKYLRFGVAEANRADYETGANRAEYFLTAPLSGCRFVLSQTKVLHIANNYGATAETTDDHGRGGSQRRTQGENLTLGNESRRRLSVSINSLRSGEDDFDASYGSVNQGLVFGFRVEGDWTYKWLKQVPESSEEASYWMAFINP